MTVTRAEEIAAKEFHMATVRRRALERLRQAIKEQQQEEQDLVGVIEDHLTVVKQLGVTQKRAIEVAESIYHERKDDAEPGKRYDYEPFDSFDAIEAPGSGKKASKEEVKDG
jgi:hypothetical protein